MAESKKSQSTAKKRVPKTRVGKAAVAKAAKAKAVAKKVPAKRVTSKAQGFTEFIRKQGVIGLAVGLAIGTQAGATVKTIVDGFINPLVGFLVGGVSLEKLVWHTGLTNNGKELVFGWGAIAASVITLVAVAAVIYFFIMGLKLDKLDKKKD